MGVWIETYCSHGSLQDDKVTPCMGVWIETALTSCTIQRNFGHTLYGCVD